MNAVDGCADHVNNEINSLDSIALHPNHQTNSFIAIGVVYKRNLTI